MTNLLLPGESAKNGMSALQGSIAHRIGADWAVQLPYSGDLYGKITTKSAFSPCGICKGRYIYNSNMYAIDQAVIKVEDGLVKPDLFRAGRNSGSLGLALEALRTPWV